MVNMERTDTYMADQVSDEEDDKPLPRSGTPMRPPNVLAGKSMTSRHGVDGDGDAAAVGDDVAVDGDGDDDVDGEYDDDDYVAVDGDVDDDVNSGGDVTDDDDDEYAVDDNDDVDDAHDVAADFDVDAPHYDAIAISIDFDVHHDDEDVVADDEAEDIVVDDDVEADVYHEHIVHDDAIGGGGGDDDDDDDDDDNYDDAGRMPSTLREAANQPRTLIDNLHDSPGTKNSNISKKRPPYEHTGCSPAASKKPKLSAAPPEVPTQSSSTLKFPSCTTHKEGSSTMCATTLEPSTAPSYKPSSPSLQHASAAPSSVVKMDIDEYEKHETSLARRVPGLAENVKNFVAKVKRGAASFLHFIGAKNLKVEKLSKRDVIKRDKKWTTLQHNGVIFPPPYKPHGVKMLYEGKPVTLTPEQEEVATLFSSMHDTEYIHNPRFLSNFWSDWKTILGPDHAIQSLEACNFTPIYEWYLVEKEARKNLSYEERKRLLEEKWKQEEKCKWAFVDGVKKMVGNVRVEPPGLFRGRGNHPKMGKLRRRILPEDVIINIGEDAPELECPIPGHRWKEVRHDHTLGWIACWNDPIHTGEKKYAFLAKSAS